MLVVRESQQREMAEARTNELVHTASRLMREAWPERCERLADDQLTAKVKRGLEIAVQFGLQGDQACCCFLNIWFVWGEEFPSRPEDGWARDILANPPGGASGDRVDRLLAEAVRQLMGQSRSAAAAGGSL